MYLNQRPRPAGLYRDAHRLELVVLSAEHRRNQLSPNEYSHVIADHSCSKFSGFPGFRRREAFTVDVASPRRRDKIIGRSGR